MCQGMARGWVWVHWVAAAAAAVSAARIASTIRLQHRGPGTLREALHTRGEAGCMAGGAQAEEALALARTRPAAHSGVKPTRP